MEMTTNIIVNLVALLGVTGILFGIRQRRVTNAIERHIAVLCLTVLIMLVMRTVYWTSDIYFAQRMALLAALAIPVIVLLTTEALLRRHAPKPVKILTLTGICVGVVVTLIDHSNLEPAFSWGIMLYQLLVLSFSVTWLVLHKRADLTPSENQNAAVFAMTLVFAVSMLATDFADVIQLPVKLGAIGLLLAVYVLTQTTLNMASLRRTILEILAISIIVVAFLFSVHLMVPILDTAALLRLGASSVAFLLAGVILTQVILSRLATDGDFCLALATANKDCLEKFLADALATRQIRHHVILDKDDLDNYNTDALAKAFGKTSILSRQQMRGTDGIRPPKEVREQLEDLFRRTQTTHAFMPSSDTPLLALVSTPAFSDQVYITNYLSLVSRLAVLSQFQGGGEDKSGEA